MFAVILEILSAALSIWANAAKTKYIDQKIAIETQYYAEQNKPDGQRSDAILDDLEEQLKVLAMGVAAEIQGGASA